MRKGHAGSADWDLRDLEEQRRRLATVPIEDRLREAIAWSAVVLADHLRRGGDGLPASPDPVGLGSRRP